MTGLDGILAKLHEVAAKAGLSGEQVAAMAQTFGTKVSGGSDHASAIAETAQEHGISLEQLQDMLAGVGGPDLILGKLAGLLDSDGDGNPLNELGSLAKGLFG